MRSLLKLISYMPDENSVEILNRYSSSLDSLGISGIETIVGDFCPLTVYQKLPIEGIHLIYFPTWLDIWYGNSENLKEDFLTDSPYGISSQEELISIFVKQFLDALELNPKYLVFHVSHVRPRDIFTMTFDYSDEDILKASAELLNQVFQNETLKEILNKKNRKEDNSPLPYLLFENLPWPGLRFTGTQIEKDFIDSILYPKKGIMLDLSHLICLNTDISNFSEAVDYIDKTLENIGDFSENIIGIHLNCSISKEYLSRDFSPLLKEWENGAIIDRYHIEISHIKSIDTHSIFKSKKLSNIIRKIAPKFLVYELGYDSFEDLLLKVEIQNGFLDCI